MLNLRNRPRHLEVSDQVLVDPQEGLLHLSKTILPPTQDPPRSPVQHPLPTMLRNHKH